MVTYCLGLPSSASTWIYNVTRDILLVTGKSPSAFTAESYQAFGDPRAFKTEDVVLRGHNIESLLFRILKLTNTKFILSFRDPRDAIASFLQRFSQYGVPFQRIFSDVVRSLAALVTAFNGSDNITFFFEDAFTSDIHSIRRIADFLGCNIKDNELKVIFDRYTVASVRDFTAAIDSLPDDRLYVDGVNNAMDRVTSFHRTHISDMRIGKWKDAFDENTRAAMFEVFGGYVQLLKDFSRTSDKQRKALPDSLKIIFKSDYFAPVDSLDKYTRQLSSAELTTDIGIRCLEYLYLPTGMWRMTLSVRSVRNAIIKICQNGSVCGEFRLSGNEHVFEFVNVLHDHPLDVHIIYDNMQSDISAGKVPPAIKLISDLLKTH